MRFYGVPPRVEIGIESQEMVNGAKGYGDKHVGADRSIAPFGYPLPIGFRNPALYSPLSVKWLIL
jgi:hypothetical protein